MNILSYIFNSIIFKIKYRKHINFFSLINNTEKITMGKNSTIGMFSVLKPSKEKNSGEINLGESTHIAENAYILGGQGKVIIGNNVQMGSSIVLLGGGNITIGNNVLMSHNITISSSSHCFKDDGVSADKYPDIFKPVIIKDNVCIGANATILMGATIGEGAVIGAGSVITENTTIGNNEVWTGNPAKVKYTRKSLKTQIETEIHTYLKDYPFHNLFLLYGFNDIFASKFGGTCSDRSVQFKNKLEKKFQHCNIDIKLHRAFINGKKTHTIIRLIIDKEVFFIDVGMGFPITKLLPIDIDMEFISYNVKFKSTVVNDELVVFVDFNDDEKELMRINIKEQSQSQVQDEINQRWANKDDLPFVQTLQYYFIHKNKFHRIQGADIFLQNNDKQ